MSDGPAPELPGGAPDEFAALVLRGALFLLLLRVVATLAALCLL